MDEQRRTAGHATPGHQHTATGRQSCSTAASLLCCLVWQLCCCYAAVALPVQLTDDAVLLQSQLDSVMRLLAYWRGPGAVVLNADWSAEKVPVEQVRIWAVHLNAV